MNYQEKCECCGGMVTAYTHNLNKPLVSALRQLVDFYAENRKGCKIQEDLNLDHNQFANFQKLRYFGLVMNITGTWLPTIEGTDFIHGKILVRNPVATFKNEVISGDHKAWETHKGKKELLGVRDIDENSYKKKEEYQAEKSRQTKLI